MTHPNDALTDNGRFASDCLKSFSGKHGFSSTVSKAEESWQLLSRNSYGMILAR